jgi:hypothetical protein
MPDQTFPNTALIVYRVKLREPFDPEPLLDGPLMVEDEDGDIIVSTADLAAATKLAAHPAVESIEEVGKAAFISDWVAR